MRVIKSLDMAVRFLATLAMGLTLTGCFLDSDNDGATAPVTPASDDAALLTLSAAPAVLTPDFAPEVTSYTASVADAVDSIQLVASLRNAGASQTLNGTALASGAPGRAISLQSGSNLITVQVTAEDGSTTRSYQLEITREAALPSADASLASLAVSTGTLVPAFGPDVLQYSATVDNATDSLQLTAQPADAGASLQLDGAPLPAATTSAPIALAVGSNEVVVLVTAEDGASTRSYTINVIREQPPVPSASVQLLVLDTTGAPVTGALVTADEQPGSAITDDEGRATVTAPAIEAAVLRLSKTGFIDQLLRLDLSAGSDPASPLRVGMVARAAAQGFAADQLVTLTGADGARVELPANAFVDALGNPVSGQIDAYITPLDISEDNSLAAFPGGFAARGPADAPGSLLTLGVADFTFEQGGQRLSLAPSVIATIEVPIYVIEDASGNLLQINDLIPLWELDEADGVWNWEGDALVVASAGSPTGLALRGEARHFSWWNADIFVGQFSGAPGAVVFESSLLPTLYCDEIGTPCDSVLVPGGGAWVTATLLRLGAPQFSTRGWVPFGEEAAELITIPITFDIDVQAAVADGFYVVTSVAPSPVRSDFGGEVIEVDVLLQRRHLVNDGLFVPGERLRGYLEVLDEVHTYRFAGRAGRVFRLRGYPAADAGSGPGITSDLGATVRVWRNEELLAEAPFDATMFADIKVTLPTDGEYRVTFTADGKVPGFYVATTALLFAQAQAGGTVAFPARSPQFGIGLYTMNEAGDGYVLLTPPGITTTCLSPVNSVTNCSALSQSPTQSGRGDGYAPGFRPGFFREVAPGQILYVSDHDRPGFADLFTLDLAEPGLATRLSGPEIAGPESYGVVDFRTIEGRPERVIYKVNQTMSATAGSQGALYVVNPAQPELRRALPQFDQRPVLEYEVSNDGRWVVYKGREPAGNLISGDLYAVDLDNPGTQPVPVNPPLDFVGGERMGSFAISPDNSRVTYSVLENVSEGVTRRQAYLADLENPGTPIRISAEINTRTMEARFSPDGAAIIYRNAIGTQTLLGAGRLFWVGISDPLQPTAAFQLSDDSVLSPAGWQIMPQGDRVLEVTTNRVYGYSLANPALGRVAREELLRLPTGMVFRGEPVLTGGGTGILLQVAEAATNLPWGLIHHRFGDPLTEYRTLFEAADFEEGAQGVTQMALSPDETTVIAFIGIRFASSERRILSVPLAGERVITELVPVRDEAQGLTLRPTLDTDRWYQFLPLK